MEKTSDNFFKAYFTESHYEFNNGIEDREKINLTLNDDGTAKIEHTIRHAGDNTNEKNIDETHTYAGKYDVLDKGSMNARIRLNVDEMEGKKLEPGDVKKPIPLTDFAKEFKKQVGQVGGKKQAIGESKEGVPKEGVPKEGVPKEGEPKEGVSKEGAGKEGAQKLSFDVRLDLFNNILRLSPDNFLTAQPRFLFLDYF